MKKSALGYCALFLLLMMQSRVAASHNREDNLPINHRSSNGGQMLAQERSSSLPDVLLVGDSVAADYVDVVRGRLQGRANVDAFIDPSPDASPEFFSRLATALGARAAYSVIHFSVGLDARTRSPTAGASMAATAKKIIELLHARTPTAKLIWATITPITAVHRPGFLDTQIDPIVADSNRLVSSLAAQSAIETNDLYRLMSAHLDQAREDGIHWNAEACNELGTAVAAAITDKMPTDAVMVYVAPDGNDANDGSLTAPFGTLERARDAVRAVMHQPGKTLPLGGIRVILRGGVYLRDRPFVLGKEDSPESGREVIYQSSPNETARLVGGRRLSADWFHPVSPDSAVWLRLSSAGRGTIRELDLRAHGITDFGQLVPRGMHHPAQGAMELFINGQPAPLAQWPKATSASVQGMGSGFARIDQVVGPQELSIPADAIARWAHADQMWLHGYWGNFWSDFHLAAATIDPAKKTITLAQAPRYAMKPGMPFRVYNLLEEITAAGDWFLDRTAGKLYIWPTADWPQAEIFVSTLADEIVTIKDAENIVLDGLVLELSWSRLLSITGGKHNLVRRCVLRNAGTDGAVISGTDNGIYGCIVENTGECGVRLSGGSRAQLVPGTNYVRHSRLSHFSRWTRTYAPGIEIQGVGQIVANNLLCDAPHAAILFFGNDHRIEFNDIHDVCLFSCDAGAIYAGRHWDFRGNVIRYNFIHNLHSPLEEAGLGENGIYLDDCISGTTVTGNILYDITGDAILCNGGRDNVMTGNIMAKCGTVLEITAFAIEHLSNQVGSSWNLIERCGDEGVHYQAEPWASAYPKLAAIPSAWSQLNAPGARWLYPENNTFAGNSSWQNAHFIRHRYVGNPAVFAEAFAPGNNLESSDPKYRDPARSDFSLPPDSPVSSLAAFAPIPFGAIGPGTTIFSTSWPQPFAR